MLKSKCYILITDTDITLAGDFRGMSRLMKLSSLTGLRKNIDSTIKELTKEGTSGRNKRGRAKSSSDKQSEVR